MTAIQLEAATPPDPDSSHPGEAVCLLPMCQMGHDTPLCRRLLLFLSCYFALRVVFAFEQQFSEDVIRHSDVMRQNCCPKKIRPLVSPPQHRNKMKIPLAAIVLTLALSTQAASVPCGSSGSDDFVDDGIQQEAQFAQCEAKLPLSFQATISVARSCNAEFRALWRGTSNDPLALRSLSESVRRCATTNEKNAGYIRDRLSQSRRALPLHSFFVESALLQHRVADSLLLVSVFNEAVNANSARVLTSSLSSLVTEDAKRLISPALSTAQLYARYQELLQSIRTDQRMYNERWNSAKETLLQKTMVEF